MKKQFRTRFAPSPTGDIHIGNLRTALYAYLLAKRYKGRFVLRIEDTDQKRFSKKYIDMIFKTFKLIDIEYDEGPGKNEKYGPYFQSERLNLYIKYAKKLIKNDYAYYCFCDKNRIDFLKKEQKKRGLFYKYDNFCRKLNIKEIKINLKKNKSYVIRQKNPSLGTTIFDDLIFGKIKINNSNLEDQILIKSDGYPTYNFANVIDDHLMKITHLIRGSEYLSSTPKYNLLYDFFKWEKPTYIHLPLILNKKGQKLSKREGDQSFYDLIKKGYLVESIINFIVLLGWNPKTKNEFFKLKELKKQFNLKGINKSPAIFDINKLNWMNGEYIRKLSLKDFHIKVLPYISKKIKLNYDTYKIASILHKRINVLNEIPDKLKFFENLINYNTDLYINKKIKLSKKIAFKILNIVLKEFEKIEVFSFEFINKNIIKINLDFNLNKNLIFFTLRIAITGFNTSAGSILEILDILGKKESINRIKKSIKLLEKGGIK